MRIRVNGETREIEAARLAAALDELGYRAARVATALNGVFVPLGQREAQRLAEGDTLEILAPMQGG
jgi:sulfur carrier protein